MTLVFGIIGVLQAFGLTQIVNAFAVPSGMHDISFIIILMILSFFAQMAIILALKFEQVNFNVLFADNNNSTPPHLSQTFVFPSPPV